MLVGTHYIISIFTNELQPYNVKNMAIERHMTWKNVGNEDMNLNNMVNEDINSSPLLQLGWSA